MSAGGSGTQIDPYTFGVKERRVAETGSYITYTGGDYTGDWVVLRNKDGQLEIISKESVGNVTLEGASGYANAVSILNTKAAEYVNTDYAVSGRSVGATEDSISQIDTTEYPLTFAAIQNTGPTNLPYKDTYYEDDYNIISKSAALKHSSSWVWLAARGVGIYDNVFALEIRAFHANGILSSHGLVGVRSNGEIGSGNGTNGVRPVITLREDMEIIGGSGLQTDPYRIAVPKEKIAIGSYVQYTAGDYDGDWVVLRNKAGQLEIISKESVGDVTLGGANGYANAVNILNTKARQYINTHYASCVYCVVCVYILSCLGV